MDYELNYVNMNDSRQICKLMRNKITQQQKNQTIELKFLVCLCAFHS